jgi:MYXO-CTERM domain-containing protein
LFLFKRTGSDIATLTLAEPALHVGAAVAIKEINMRHMPTFKAMAVTAVASAALSLAGVTQAATVSYSFDYPATGSAAPHTPVATLTLTDIAGGVQFLLQPAWAVVGSGVQWDELQLTYQGPALAGLTFSDLGPAIIDPTKLAVTTSGHTGYTPEVGFLGVHWDNTGQNHHFDITHGSSSWSLTGTGLTLDSFTGSFANAQGKISPIYAILSGQGLKGEPSNWVSVVPEPSAYAMALAGLGMLALFARRRAAR